MIQISSIKPNMPVVCSNGVQFAVIDHMEGKDTIKLTRDTNGKHRYFPLSWVKNVDSKVHVSLTGEQALRQLSDQPPTKTAAGGASEGQHDGKLDGKRDGKRPGDTDAEPPITLQTAVPGKAMASASTKG